MFLSCVRSSSRISKFYWFICWYKVFLRTFSCPVRGLETALKVGSLSFCDEKAEWRLYHTSNFSVNFCLSVWIWGFLQVSFPHRTPPRRRPLRKLHRRNCKRSTDSGLTQSQHFILSARLSQFRLRKERDGEMENEEGEKKMQCKISWAEGWGPRPGWFPIMGPSPASLSHHHNNNGHEVGG